jgi:hypothetical protein
LAGMLTIARLLDGSMTTSAANRSGTRGAYRRPVAALGAWQAGGRLVRL